MKRSTSRTSDREVAFPKLLKFVSATILLSIVGYFIIMVLFYIFTMHLDGPERWSLFEGFVGIITLSILIGGLTYTINDRIQSDVAEARERNKLSYEIYHEIFNMLTDPEQEAARRWILANIPMPGDDLNAWYQETHTKVMRCENGGKDGLPEGQRSVKLTLNCLDFIGFIVENKYWDVEEKENSLDWLSPPIAKMWRRLGPYVKQIRVRRGAEDYYRFAEYIGNQCIEYREARGFPDEATNIDLP